jgi:hypothetical protein
MAFKAVLDLNAEVTISLGGINKKTGKANPKSIEGYYLGKKAIEDRKKKSGVSYIYILQTDKGNVGVWGKTDMDRKILSVREGEMIRITHTGMAKTANGDMYKYSVEVDSDNTIEVLGSSSSSSSSSSNDDESPSYDYDEELDSNNEDEEVSYAASKASELAASERRAKAAALLSKNKK